MTPDEKATAEQAAAQWARDWMAANVAVDVETFNHLVDMRVAWRLDEEDEMLAAHRRVLDRLYGQGRGWAEAQQLIWQSLPAADLRATAVLDALDGLRADLDRLSPPGRHRAPEEAT